ncbi:SIS domain-containing protein [Salisediminibacterium halotolerans]|uniref:UPF0309 protein SAMN05444126_11140 n=1 Tax=Salisediminibacterium halotolerans TaxID=517425 RepID=A0A1H9TUK7_9BACI|nr:SIS domain-containing protein [Salisediminibacterium haloalkalitolerans]SES00806.1 Uncharacterized protein, contains SIS (Sugar ISomerase) phosphosugar binding domain [Salisediminibacterium haloalkalitolerans]
MLTNYISSAQEKLERLKNEQPENFSGLGEKLADAIDNGGIIHIFGAGHSHILAEEVFYRAGGLVPVSPILHEPLMLHEGALRSSDFERKNDYADTFMEQADIRPEDVLIVSSTSGRNPVPVDAALYAKNKGAYVVGITSLVYSASQSSRHQDGYKLTDVVDTAIDNYSEAGDAALTHPDVDVPFGPTSTLIGVAIMQSLMAETIRALAVRGETAPVLKSGNIDGADERNRQLIEAYKERIPLLR